MFRTIGQATWRTTLGNFARGLRGLCRISPIPVPATAGNVYSAANYSPIITGPGRQRGINLLFPSRLQEKGAAKTAPRQPGQFSPAENKYSRSKGYITIPAFLDLLRNGPLKYPILIRDGDGRRKVTVSIEDMLERIRPPIINVMRPQGADHFFDHSAECLNSASITFTRNDSIIAKMKIGDDEYTVGIVEKPGGLSTLAMLPSPESSFVRSSCDFHIKKDGTLVISKIITDSDFRRRGLGTALQHFAYIIAGRPGQIVFEISGTHPAYGEIADAFLDSGDFNPFYPVGFAKSMSRLFGRQVTGLHLLNEDIIHIMRTRLFELKVNSTFHLEISLNPLE